MANEEKSGMTFYQLSALLGITAGELFQKYKELFPNIKLLDYNCGILRDEALALKKVYIKDNSNE
jgi:hypothetical protein